MSTLPSKREFLNANINPSTGEPFAALTRGRFSREAEAFAAANAGKWAEAAKPVKAPRPTVVKASAPAAPAAPKVSSEGLNGKEVRAWAKQNGFEVGARGRMPVEVITAYVKANGRPTGQAAPRPQAVIPKVRRESTGYVVEGRTVIALTKCAASNKGGCGKNVSACTCKTGPLAPHYLPEGLALTPLLLSKPAL